MFADAIFRRRVFVGMINAAALLAMVAAEVLLAAAAAHEKDPDRIVISDFMFTPAELTIAAGAKVTWVNQDEAPHTIIDDSKTIRSDALDTGDKFQFVFTRPGTYTYHCSLHPQMTGQIIVR